MKTKNLVRIFLVVVLTLTLPISQVYAVVPDLQPLMTDVVERFGEGFDLAASGVGQTPAPVVNISTAQLVKSAVITPSQIVEDEAPALEAVELKEAPEMDFVPIQAEEGHPFWTKKKIVISATLLLTATVLLSGLLFLLGGSGSGSGSGSGDGSGGGPGGPGEPGGPPGDGGPGDGGPGDGNPFIPPVGGGGPIGPGTGNPGDPFVSGDPIPGGIPHHPEPSTFLLMGLGLIVPLLRKRWS